MLRRWPLYLLALLPLCNLACAHQSRAPGVLRVAVESDASTLDPARAYDTSSIPWVRLLYRGLVDYDNDANITNEVAAARKVSPDGKSYWFKLRHDVYFQSGRRVVAEDFRYALERVLDPATVSDGLALPGYLNIVGAGEFSKATGALDTKITDASDPAARQKLAQHKRLLHLTGIEVRGDDEIIYHLNHADATFYNYLSLPFAYAIPRETVEKWGKGFSEHPNGCGPFILDEWVHDATLRFSKNPHYFHPDLPKCERIDVQMGNSSTLQIMRFEQGSIDVLNISDAFPPDFLRLTHDPRWQPYILHAPMMDIRYMSLNCELPPFKDKRVRQAVNYAIDHARIASFVAGRATVAAGPLPPGMPGYNPNLFHYEHDPAKAKELLQQAGYKDDPTNPLVLWYPTVEAWYEKAAQSIKEDLKEVGITVNLKPVRYPEIKAAAGKRKTLQMGLMGWIQDFPDPSNFLDILYNTKSITETASQNRSFYSNPQVDKLLDAAAVELNRPKRLGLYQQAESMIVHDAAQVFLFHTERYAMHQPWITGYTLHPMWSQRYEYVGAQP